MIIICKYLNKIMFKMIIKFENEVLIGKVEIYIKIVYKKFQKILYLIERGMGGIRRYILLDYLRD